MNFFQKNFKSLFQNYHNYLLGWNSQKINGKQLIILIFSVWKHGKILEHFKANNKKLTGVN